ncbi:hypothetical protein [Micromonospora chalcea]|uniref:LexA family protein n=1 Tax=Micromonospora chalcea TaxID=1874 RepID=UPI003D71BE09
MPERRALTAAQERLLDAARAHLDEHGDVPMAEDLALATGLQSTAVLSQLGELGVQGYLSSDPLMPGHLRINDSGRAAT